MLSSFMCQIDHYKLNGIHWFVNARVFIILIVRSLCWIIFSRSPIRRKKINMEQWLLFSSKWFFLSARTVSVSMTVVCKHVRQITHLFIPYHWDCQLDANHPIKRRTFIKHTINFYYLCHVDMDNESKINIRFSNILLRFPLQTHLFFIHMKP